MSSAFSRDEIIKEIQRIAKLLGRSPGVEAFARESGIKRHHWLGVYWARWSDALADAGLETNSLNSRKNSAEILKRLADLSLSKGRVPAKAELKLVKRDDPTFPHDEVFTRHFGGRIGLYASLAKLAETSPEYAELLTILPARKQLETKPSTRAAGWVYLLQSGNHFKVGRSDTLERRVREISVALPEAVNLVHAIETDDPVGIEAYWHKRFADKRANGEWFRLELDDLRAFKRRKFQ